MFPVKNNKNVYNFSDENLNNHSNINRNTDIAFVGLNRNKTPLRDICQNTIFANKQSKMRSPSAFRWTATPPICPAIKPAPIVDAVEPNKKAKLLALLGNATTSQTQIPAFSAFESALQIPAIDNPICLGSSTSPSPRKRKLEDSVSPKADSLADTPVTPFTDRVPSPILHSIGAIRIESPIPQLKIGQVSSDPLIVSGEKAQEKTEKESCTLEIVNVQPERVASLIQQEKIKKIFEKFKDNYSFAEKLGQGGQGCVYKVRDTKNPNVDLVIKFNLKAQYYSHAIREAKYLRFIQNVRHGLKLFRFFDMVPQDTYGIVTNYIPYPDVQQSYFGRNKTAEINYLTAREIFKQSLEFLVDLHLKKIVHTDIKPSNMIYDTLKNELTVIDMGSAREKIEQNALIQTLHYRAPEIFLGGKADTGIDIWGLGCTAFLLFTGKLLFPTVRFNKEEAEWVTFNNHLHMIFSRVGLQVEFLDECVRASNYFEKDAQGYKFRNPISKGLHVPEEKWQEEVLKAAETMRFPKTKADELVDLLSKMVCLKNRISASGALSHPFFQ